MSSQPHLSNSFSLPSDSIDRWVLDELEKHCSCLRDQLIEWPDQIKVRIGKGVISLYDCDDGKKTKLVTIGEGEQGFWATCAYLRCLQVAAAAAIAVTATAATSA